MALLGVASISWTIINIVKAGVMWSWELMVASIGLDLYPLLAQNTIF